MKYRRHKHQSLTWRSYLEPLFWYTFLAYDFEFWCHLFIKQKFDFDYGAFFKKVLGSILEGAKSCKWNWLKRFYLEHWGQNPDIMHTCMCVYYYIRLSALLCLGCVRYFVEWASVVLVLVYCNFLKEFLWLGHWETEILDIRQTR